MAEYEKLSPCGIAIFIVPPTYQTWIEELNDTKQKQIFQAEWQKRHQSSIEVANYALEVPYYHVIINDDLDDAVRFVMKSLSVAIYLALGMITLG